MGPIASFIEYKLTDSSWKKKQKDITFIEGLTYTLLSIEKKAAICQLVFIGLGQQLKKNWMIQQLLEFINFSFLIFFAFAEHKENTTFRLGFKLARQNTSVSMYQTQCIKSWSGRYWRH